MRHFQVANSTKLNTVIAILAGRVDDISSTPWYHRSQLLCYLYLSVFSMHKKILLAVGLVVYVVVVE